MRKTISTVALSIALAAAGACKKKAEEAQPAAGAGGATAPTPAKKKTIQNIGSDTLVNVAQAWAEEYAKVNPGVSVEVSGGGSGIGIAALLNGTADIANASRDISEKEIAKAKAGGIDPKEFTVGYDALSFYVHKDNPLAEISVEELADLYKEGGKITKWSQLGVKKIPGGKGDDLVIVNRQNSSGTYHFVREHVLKNADFRSGTLDMSGSKDVVELIAKTPNAIGYSGMGYATPEVKMLKVSPKKGAPAVAPSMSTALDKSYPIARALLMYTPGEPSGEVKNYLDWILSDAGQKVVEKSGFVPIKKP